MLLYLKCYKNVLLNGVNILLGQSVVLFIIAFAFLTGMAKLVALPMVDYLIIDSGESYCMVNSVRNNGCPFVRDNKKSRRTSRQIMMQTAVVRRNL